MSDLVLLADRVLNRPLLITRDKAEVVLSVLGSRIGVNAPVPDASRFEGDAIKRDENGRPVGAKPYRVSNGVGIITVTGSLVNRGAWVGASSGLTSYEGIGHQIKTAMADPDVRSIILDLHSPGGEAVGAFETAALVREAAAQKRTVAVVNGMAASAAYAIASGANEIVTTETGVSGSIGVVLLHADFSRKLDREGISPTLIHAGAHKVDGNPFEPLTEEVREALKAEVDAFYGAFLSTVAKGRGNRLSQASARKTEAKIFIGKAAVDVGVADRVGSFESVLSDLTRAGRRTTVQQRRTSMDTQEEATVTKATHDAAVTAARNEGVKAGATGERDRFKAVFGHEAYAGREKSAHHMLTTTDMTAEAITGVLAGIPAAPAAAAAPAAPEGRSKDAPGGLAQVDPASGAQANAKDDGKSAWKSSIDKVNSRIN